MYGCHIMVSVKAISECCSTHFVYYAYMHFISNIRMSELRVHENSVLFT